MKIKDLPKPLIDLAYLRHREQRKDRAYNYGDFLDCSVSTDFTWVRTDEGQEFWGRIDRGMYGEEEITIACRALDTSSNEPVIPLLFN